jgi:hypothetical protein
MINSPVKFILAIGVFGLVSCNVSPTNSGTKPEGEDSTADQAFGSAGGEGFSLSLPELPGTPTGNAVARLQIFKGSIRLKFPGCIVPGVMDFTSPPSEDAISSPGEPTTPPVTGDAMPPAPLPPTQSVTDLKVAYLPGKLIGPVKLPEGAYTVLFTVVGQSSAKPSLLRFAVSPFKVSSDIISEVRLNLRRIEDCDGKGNGGVVFSPVEDGKRQPKPYPHPTPEPGPKESGPQPIPMPSTNP